MSEPSARKPALVSDDTHRILRGKSDCQLYFMIGADAFLDILTWRSHLKVLHSVNIILSRRKGYKGKQLSYLLKKLGYKASDGAWQGEDGKKDIFILEKMCLYTILVVVFPKAENSKPCRQEDRLVAVFPNLCWTLPSTMIPSMRPDRSWAQAVW